MTLFQEHSIVKYKEVFKTSFFSTTTILQWGNSTSTTVYFPISFNNNYQVFKYCLWANNGNAYHTALFYITDKKLSYLTYSANEGLFSWFAVGY